MMHRMAMAARYKPTTQVPIYKNFYIRWYHSIKDAFELRSSAFRCLTQYPTYDSKADLMHKLMSNNVTNVTLDWTKSGQDTFQTIQIDDSCDSYIIYFLSVPLLWKQHPCSVSLGLQVYFVSSLLSEWSRVTRSTYASVLLSFLLLN